jgi:hypothetical protein
MLNDLSEAAGGIALKQICKLPKEVVEVLTLSCVNAVRPGVSSVQMALDY